MTSEDEHSEDPGSEVITSGYGATPMVGPRSEAIRTSSLVRAVRLQKAETKRIHKDMEAIIKESRWSPDS